MTLAPRHRAVAPLGQLLQGWLELAPALAGLPVSGLAIDSRRLQPGEVFLAYGGDQADGRDFAAEAEARGAAAIIAEPGRRLAVTVPVVELAQLRQRVGELAARLYGHPSRHMAVVGVTGTNGKTTSVQLITQLLRALGQPSGSIGTLGIDPPPPGEAEGGLTTPDPITLQAQLARWRHQNLAVAMEVSSHALDQARVGGIHFRVAAFTNLSRDHLDYHAGMDAYRDAKARLFGEHGPERVVLNADDPASAAMARHCRTGTEVLRYSASGNEADVRCLAVRHGSEGTELEVDSPWGRWTLHSPLLGEFNVANLLLALTVVALLQRVVDAGALSRAVAALKPVPGRLQALPPAPGQPRVVVDYAHSPAALRQAIAALRPHCTGRLWCVFGAGGERDAGKRPEMGEAAMAADHIVLTSDNPRRESAAAIADQIRGGIAAEGPPVTVELNREQAIRLALAGAAPEDWVLLAGKGHERYQEIDGRRHPFDDVEVARAALTQPGQGGLPS